MEEYPDMLIGTLKLTCCKRSAYLLKTNYKLYLLMRDPD